MTPNENLWQAQLAAQRAHFILEQFAQRLDQRHVHPFGQTADIVMALDRDARPAGKAHAFDNIRIQRPLSEKISPTDFLCFIFKDFDEGLADEFAFDLWIGQPGKPVQEQRLGIYMHERNIIGPAKQRHDLIRFAAAHQPVVDEHACQLIANRFMDEHRRNR